MEWSSLRNGTGYAQIGSLRNSSPEEAKINPDVDRPVIYRHNEDAVVGFYDSHAVRMKKENIFIKADYYADPPITAIWTSSPADGQGNTNLFRMVLQRQRTGFICKTQSVKNRWNCRFQNLPGCLTTNVSQTFAST